MRLDPGGSMRRGWGFARSPPRQAGERLGSADAARDPSSGRARRGPRLAADPTAYPGRPSSALWRRTTDPAAPWVTAA